MSPRKRLIQGAVLIGAASGFAAVMVLAQLVSAEEIDKPGEMLGKPLPAFVLDDYTGKAHDLAKLKGKAVVVLAFTSQKCPYSRAGDPRLAALAKRYAEQKVAFLSIDSHKDTRPEEIKEYAEKANGTGEKLPYPILKDAGNKYADAVNAKRTPEVFILDKDLNLAYHGALDNQKKPEDKAYVNHVAEALDDLLAGEPVSNPKTAAYGCSIKRIG